MQQQCHRLLQDQQKQSHLSNCKPKHTLCPAWQLPLNNTKVFRLGEEIRSQGSSAMHQPFVSHSEEQTANIHSHHRVWAPGTPTWEWHIWVTHTHKTALTAGEGCFYFFLVEQASFERGLSNFRGNIFFLRLDGTPQVTSLTRYLSWGV